MITLIQYSLPALSSARNANPTLLLQVPLHVSEAFFLSCSHFHRRLASQALVPLCTNSQYLRVCTRYLIAQKIQYSSTAPTSCKSFAVSLAQTPSTTLSVTGREPNSFNLDSESRNPDLTFLPQGSKVST